MDICEQFLVIAKNFWLTFCRHSVQDWSIQCKN